MLGVVVFAVTDCVEIKHPGAHIDPARTVWQFFKVTATFYLSKARTIARRRKYVLQVPALMQCHAHFSCHVTILAGSGVFQIK